LRGMTHHAGPKPGRREGQQTEGGEHGPVRLRRTHGGES
jgi:hypothetical protein